MSAILASANYFTYLAFSWSKIMDGHSRWRLELTTQYLKNMNTRFFFHLSFQLFIKRLLQLKVLTQNWLKCQKSVKFRYPSYLMISNGFVSSDFYYMMSICIPVSRYSVEIIWKTSPSLEGDQLKCRHQSYQKQLS